MTCRVAVIGVGVMGANHARIYHALDGVQLVGVVETDAARGREVAQKCGCAYYPSLSALLAHESIDAASVAVPTSLHATVAGDLLQRRIDLLVEKPLAPTLDECKRLCDLATAQNAILMVGHIERFNPAVRHLHKLIREGIFGEITSLITRRVGLAPPRIRDADVVTDLAVHDIDIANYLIGREPQDVYANSGRGRLSDRLDFSEIFLNYGSCNAIISVNWLTPLKIRKLSITGTLGYAELDFVRQELMIYQSPESRSFSDYGDFLDKFGRDSAIRAPVKTAEPLANELQHFIECVTRRQTPEISCAEAMSVMRIVEKVIH